MALASAIEEAWTERLPLNGVAEVIELVMSFPQPLGRAPSGDPSVDMKPLRVYVAVDVRAARACCSFREIGTGWHVVVESLGKIRLPRSEQHGRARGNTNAEPGGARAKNGGS